MGDKYLLFGGSLYYPYGGASDLIGVFDSRAEADKAFADNPKEWGQIASFTDGDYISAGYINVLAEYEWYTDRWVEVKSSAP